MARKILAIDDHPDTIQLIEMALQRHGYEVVGAFSGPEGLELAEQERSDLILLDMMMPGMDGNAVCRAIRQNPDLKDTPVIMFTAKSQATDKKSSFDAGADDYVTKPTRPAELLQRIESLLGRYHGAPSGAQEPPLQTGYMPRGPQFISVLGARGGAGASTVALNLAATMADAEADTVLADLDTRQGHLALYLGHNAGPDILDWLSQPAGSLDETLVDYLIQIQEHLALLPSRMRPNGDEGQLRAPQTAALTTILSDTGRIVVADLGTPVGDAVRPILQSSDVILLCLRPERAAIVGARRKLEYLQQQVEDDKIQLLMLDYGSDETMPRPAVESYLERALCDVIQLDEQALTRAVNRHQPLIFSGGEGKPLRQFRRLVRQLIPGS
ncbi:MAG TPA: response regulator [Candidatus Binatia bacterium]|nr:response regulator [Candidatus Binatia bacterium]